MDPVHDHADVHGLLARLWGLGLPSVSVTRVECGLGAVNQVEMAGSSVDWPRAATRTAASKSSRSVSLRT